MAITVGNAIVNETDTQLVFEVMRSGDLSPAVVSYLTDDHTATAGSDYIATAGTLSFLDGEVSKTVAVSLSDSPTVVPPDDDGAMP